MLFNEQVLCLEFRKSQLEFYKDFIQRWGKFLYNVDVELVVLNPRLNFAISQLLNKSTSRVTLYQNTTYNTWSIFLIRGG